MIQLPIAPMEATAVEVIPEGPEWQYEPKWDGFRCIASRAGTTVRLQSKAQQPLERYFPELVDAFLSLDAKNFVLDGEIAIPRGKSFSFDALLQRIHPAASRVTKLAKETPAIFIAFDILAASAGSVLLEKPLTVRRPELEDFARTFFPKAGRLKLSPCTRKLQEAGKWLKRAGGALDGIIAKRVDVPYASGVRSAMQKIKNYRSADCVVGGFRYASGRKVVGSLLLGLYDALGDLHHVGFTSAFSTKEKKELLKIVEPLKGESAFTGRAPGGPSRWNRGASSEWEPLKPELVVEVSYDHASEDRFRHGTKILRWRPDKAAAQCTMDQLRHPAANLIQLL